MITSRATCRFACREPGKDVERTLAGRPVAPYRNFPPSTCRLRFGPNGPWLTLRAAGPPHGLALPGGRNNCYLMERTAVGQYFERQI